MDLNVATKSFDIAKKALDHLDSNENEEDDIEMRIVFKSYA
tara:strand:- start:294 stop:416 length:123 start_codon:yes stop_codon:yes gene_type:complete